MELQVLLDPKIRPGGLESMTMELAMKLYYMYSCV